jgi:hypothetical protein
MNSKTWRIIAIGLVAVALVLTILNWQGMVTGTGGLRTVLLILGVVAIFFARRKEARG